MTDRPDSAGIAASLVADVDAAEQARKRAEEERLRAAGLLDPARRAAAELTGLKGSEIRSVKRTRAGTVIEPTTGPKLIYVPVDKPDGEGRSGLMLIDEPRYPGSLPVYVSSRDARRRRRAEERAAVEASSPEVFGGVLAQCEAALAELWAGDAVVGHLAAEVEALELVASSRSDGTTTPADVVAVERALMRRRIQLRAALQGGAPERDVHRKVQMLALARRLLSMPVDQRRAAWETAARDAGWLRPSNATTPEDLAREARAWLQSQLLDDDGKPTYDSALVERLRARLDGAAGTHENPWRQRIVEIEGTRRPPVSNAASGDYDLPLPVR